MITADLLTRIPLFAGIPAGRARVARGPGRRCSTPPGRMAASSKGQTPAFFALLEGQAGGAQDHRRAGPAARDLRAGRLLRRSAAAPRSPAVASVRATRAVARYASRSADFHDLITHCRVLNGEIMKTMARRVGRCSRSSSTRRDRRDADRPISTISRASSSASSSRETT